ncbi:hypothetical protein HML84_00385 [Alcanivorax sp. IO_7]|nr:hypothetical protein HML84_00385 [Alcanivorax sp. IO_7]
MYLQGFHILPALCVIVLLGGCASTPPTTATIPELKARDAAETPSPPPAMPAWLAAAQARRASPASTGTARSATTTRAGGAGCTAPRTGG